MNDLVTISGLSKAYGHFMALNNLNLNIPRGRIIGLLGPNGSGKTTLIKLLNGLLTPSSGQILIDGKAPGVETKKKVSYLPERTYLTSSRTVIDLVEYFEDFYDNFNREKAMSMLESLQINLNSRLKTLSKGTKEKVQLILAMSRAAKLYLLDEPIGGVDPAARDYILSTILNNYSRDATVILSTHLIGDIEPILDEAVFLKDGRVFAHRNAEELRETEGMSVDAYFREVFKC
mgnify:CR=1 FL=1